ncbi:MAG: rubrerythrin family protein [Candidatus Gastranaerophilales bacterium]|nr:rubrerythrin family protein [Candidatus Gastranaerophilales bacterium]
MEKAKNNSKTQQCLMKAFIGEGAARNRYTYFAKIAKKEGYEQISSIFLETADNERAHAKRFFNFLGEDYAPITVIEAAYPMGLNNSTLKNLEFAANGEHEESSILYPAFAEIAESEGYSEIADNINEIIEVEIIHEKRYLDLMENIIQNKVFKREKEVIWKCRNCGYHHKGNTAPEHCPACKHAASYFELFVKNY